MSLRARPTSGGFEAFRSELRRDWRAGSDLAVLEAVDSTNAVARRALQDDATAPLGLPRVFVAWSQTAGRGRRGSSWSSPPGGGIYASVAMPLSGSAALEALPILLPVAACQALRSLGVPECGLKWPNDLLVGGRKLGGSLVEAVTVGSEPKAAVLGLGVNYGTPADPDLARLAIGLDGLLRPLPTLATLVRRVLEPLLDRIAHFEASGIEELITAYRELMVHRPGERLACRTATETVRGDFAGFDDRGFLRLAVRAGERLIGSGEVVES